MKDTEKQANDTAQSITILGGIADLLLGVLKIVVGSASASAALVADGIHSLSDLVTDVLVIVVLKISRHGPDQNHPWGHGRFETLATVILGTLLMAIGGVLAYESLIRLGDEQTQTPHWLALAVAALSLVVKEGFFQVSYQIGKRLNSQLLIANAWHSRTDALSSVVVFIGVAGSIWGLYWLDAVAAILVAGLLAKIGYSMAAEAVNELVDTALPPEEVAEFKKEICAIDGILNVHSLKTRKMASHTLLEMHLQVTPLLSASEGHYLGDQAVAALREKHPELRHIVFHIDTYNDEAEHKHAQQSPMTQLPSRAEIWRQLEAELLVLAPNLRPCLQMNLTYGKQVNIDLLLTPEVFISKEELDQLSQAITTQLKSAKNADWFGSLRLWQGLAALQNDTL